MNKCFSHKLLPIEQHLINNVSYISLKNVCKKEKSEESTHKVKSIQVIELCLTSAIVAIFIITTHDHQKSNILKKCFLYCNFRVYFDNCLSYR